MIYILVLGLPACALADGPDSKDGVARIRELYGQINQSIQKGSVDLRLYCHDNNGDWSRIKTRPKTLSPSCWSFAQVFRIGGLVRKVSVLTASESGDWSDLVEHYFYDSGLLAFQYREHRTFNGGVPDSDAGFDPPFVVESRRYFDVRGVSIRATEKAYAAESRIAIDSKFVQVPNGVTYQSTAQIPFEGAVHKP